MTVDVWVYELDVVNILPCILLLFALQFTSALGNPISIRQNETIEELTTKSGDIYKDVTIREIKKTGVKIMHSYGSRTIPADELPEYAFLFKRIEEPEKKAPLPQATNNKATPKAQPKLAWEPKSLDDVTEACLLVGMPKCMNDDGSVGSYVASAFLCNIGKITYIYSNVHNFFGTKEFFFEFKDGRKIDPREYAGVEVATGKAGYNKKLRWGGDVIRIRLKQYHPKALTLDQSRPLTKSKDIGRDIAVTGNTSGGWVITKLEGKITDISDYDIIDHNAATEQGNSGSPIVDMRSLKVIGILTWGLKTEDAVGAIWKKKSINEREGVKSGASLARIKFMRSSFKSLYEERLVLNRMKNEIRILGLLDTLVPKHEGLLVNTRQRVMGDYTVDDLLESNPDHIVVRRLISLDKKLSFRKDSNIKRANQDTFRLYRNTYTACIKDVMNTRRQIESSASYKSSYFKYSMKNTKLIPICKAYEKGLSRTLSWFKKQMGTKGDAIPLGSRPRLPDINSGLEGLGIQKE